VSALLAYAPFLELAAGVLACCAVYEFFFIDQHVEEYEHDEHE